MDSRKAFLLAEVTSSCQGPSLRASAGEGQLATLKQRPMDTQLARTEQLLGPEGQPGVGMQGGQMSWRQPSGQLQRQHLPVPRVPSTSEYNREEPDGFPINPSKSVLSPGLKQPPGLEPEPS